MADPQRHLDLGAERKNEWEAYEQRNHGGGREEGECAIGVRGFLEGSVDKQEQESAAAAKSVLEDTYTHKAKTDTAAASHTLVVPVIRKTVPDSDTLSTILSSQNVEDGVTPEGCYSNSLEQQRRQRVRFDEALRMHSYGESQYVGRVVDKDVERRAKVGKEREEEKAEAKTETWGGSG